MFVLKNQLVIYTHNMQKGQTNQKRNYLKKKKTKKRQPLLEFKQISVKPGTGAIH